MDFYIAPRFLDKVAVHVTKNFLDIPYLQIPLILGIHGPKGEGKTFQCKLAFQQMGLEVVRISGGELESPDAGDPARLIRLRYREAAELIRVRGRMVVLAIEDLDAGAGRFDRWTQYTVNTQLVNATLMNIADSPTDVQLPGSYDATPLHRVPIIVTGNDFSTLYAPLIRDGRMEKFYWQPERDERVGIVSGMFAAANITLAEIGQLVDAFPDRSIDFFSALRSRLYDEQVRVFIAQIGMERVSARLVNSTEAPPRFEPPDFSLARLMAVGHLVEAEHRQIDSLRLSRTYNRVLLQTDDVSPSSRKTLNAITPDAKIISAETQAQVSGLLANGCQVGIEYADPRRFRTSSWQCATTIAPGENAEAIARVTAVLAEHPDDYVRLVGIDPQAKRRVAEHVIQRPSRHQ